MSNYINKRDWNLPFLGGVKITQLFGRTEFSESPAGKIAYMGFPHEGIDLISWDESAYPEVYSVCDGTVVVDNDNYSGVPFLSYGNVVIIKENDTDFAWYYCHLDSNKVNVGQKILKGQVIGIMGGSGNTTRSAWGNHLHFGLAQLDENYKRINQNNGTYGFVDPLQKLEMHNQKKEDGKIVEIVEEQKYGWDKSLDANEVPGYYINSEKVSLINSLLDRDVEISKLKFQLENLQNQIIEAQKKQVVEPVKNDPQKPIENEVSQTISVTSQVEGQKPVQVTIDSNQQVQEFKGKLNLAEAFLKNNLSTITTSLGGLGIVTSQDQIFRIISLVVIVIGYLYVYYLEVKNRK